MLTDQVVLVTGAASGIGRAIALLAAREGAHLVLADVDPHAGNETMRQVRTLGREALFATSDVGQPDDAQALAYFGRLDVACNNAGIGGPSALLADYPLDGWAQVINVNLSGVFYGMRCQIPALLRSGGGSIVNVASILGTVGFATAAAYAAAKHGVLGLTQTAALEYSAQGVRVNAVGPGFIQTPMISALDADPAVARRVGGGAPHRPPWPARGSGRASGLAGLQPGVLCHRRLRPRRRRLPRALSASFFQPQEHPMSIHHPIRTAFLATSITALAALGACSKSAETEASPPLSSPMTLGTQVDDTVITSGVKSALIADDLVKSLDLQVETRKGVVQLSGFVDSQAQIEQALALTRAVSGVTDVENGISLKGAPGTVGSAIDDTTVTGRVKSALLADPGIKSLDISVLTHKGEVQLTGFVNSPDQIEQAGKLAAAAEGVSGVKNELMIKK